MNKKEIEKAAEVLRVLGHPTRLEILKSLSTLGTCNVTFLTEQLKLTQSNTSQHLSSLKNVGIIENNRCGNENFYEINEHLKEYIYSIIKVVSGDKNVNVVSV